MGTNSQDADKSLPSVRTARWMEFHFETNVKLVSPLGFESECGAPPSVFLARARNMARPFGIAAPRVFR